MLQSPLVVFHVFVMFSMIFGNVSMGCVDRVRRVWENHENMKKGIGDFSLFFLSLSLSLSSLFSPMLQSPLVVFSCFHDFRKRGESPTPGSDYL